MKKIIYTFLILVTVFVILTIYFLFTPIPKYLQSFVKNSVNEQLAKLSDYQMDSLSVETSLWGILQLKPYVLNVKLSDVKNNNNWVIIDGLLDTKMSGSIIQIKIKPKVKVSGFSFPPSIFKDGNTAIDVRAEFNYEVKELVKVEIHLNSKNIEYIINQWKLSVSRLSTVLNLAPNKTDILVKVGEVLISDMAEEHIVNIKEIEFQNTALLKDPFEFTKNMSSKSNLHFKEVEFLWGDFYFFKNFADTQLSQIVRLDEINLQARTSLVLSKKHSVDTEVQINTFNDWLVDKDINKAEIHLKSSNIPFVFLYNYLKPIFAEQLDDLDIKFLTGKFKLSAEMYEGNSKADLRINNLSAVSEENKFYFKGLKLHLPIKSYDVTQAELSIDHILWKNIQGDFEETKFNISIGQDEFQLSSQGDVGINLGELPLKMGPIQIHKTKINSVMHTSLSLAPTTLSHILKSTCIVNKSLPPVSIKSKKLDITMSDDRFVVGGKVNASLFDGLVTLKDVKLFRLFSDIPETQFNLNWNGLKLQSMGNWLNFGKMQGVFEGYLSNVVLQQSLPTQFNFKAHLQPYQENEVVFSTEAMKNFVSLVTANDIGKTMPAYLSWFAFSWPSDLLGGYNINYAGVSLYAVNGSILLETLDPPSVIEKEKKHYLLYGQRFKMPLVSSSYPVVLDAFGVTHFFRHVQRQLDSLQKSKIKDEKSKAKGVELKDNNITETITQVENNKDETACFQWKNN